MRRIVPHAIIRVVQPQIVEYTCDFCGEVCGTRKNPKRTWYNAKTRIDEHYCRRTCSPHSGQDVLDALARIGTR